MRELAEEALEGASAAGDVRKVLELVGTHLDDPEDILVRQHLGGSQVRQLLSLHQRIVLVALEHPVVVRVEARDEVDGLLVRRAEQPLELAPVEHAVAVDVEVVEAGRQLELTQLAHAHLESYQMGAGRRAGLPP